MAEDTIDGITAGERLALCELKAALEALEYNVNKFKQLGSIGKPDLEVPMNHLQQAIKHLGLALNGK